MTDRAHARARAVFLRAVRLAPEAREAFLDRSCADAPALRREVEALLEHHRPTDSDGRLTRLAQALDVGAGVEGAGEGADEALPKEVLPEIDGYRVLGRIAEGGMGTVYDAEQLRPVARRVAVKLLKRGFDTAEILARFDLERQALAMTEHPGIARIFDAGETRDGRPFFAMEHVGGEKITDFANARQFDVRARLRLFLGVCAAVQHAHQKGILHRDLKPSNILARSFEGRPAVKVIDFGIAKTLGTAGDPSDSRTELGQRLGTPAYMSPEQSDPTGRDVDTRTDVYALGVVLFELLTDELPFAHGRRDANDTAPRASARVRVADDAPARAAARGTTAPNLVRQLRRGLDWIAAKALDSDREARYASASELAADVERFLDDEPVLAARPSPGERLRWFARRHRVAVAVAAATLAALLVGLVGTSLGLLRARRAETEARQQARTAEEVSDFLVEIFDTADPYAGGDLDARALLGRGRTRIEGLFSGDPAIRAALLRALGRVHTRLALYDEAEPLLAESLALAQQAFGSGDPRAAAPALNLAWLYNEQGRYDEAEPLLEAAIDAFEASAAPPVADLAQAHHVLGVIHRNRGDLARGRQHLERSLEQRLTHLGPEHRDTAFSLYHLGWLTRQEGQYAAAEDLYRRALAIWTATDGPDSALVGWCHNDLGVVLLDLERPVEAQDHLERALEVQETALGVAHPAVVAPLQSLANLHGGQGRREQAVTLLRRALDIREQTFGPEHVEVASLLSSIAFQLRESGRWDEAEATFLRARDMTRRTAGTRSQLYANVLNNLAGLYRGQGRLDDARSLIEEVLEIQRQTLGDDHPELAFAVSNLAITDFAAFRFDAAAEGFAWAAELRERGLGEGYALGYTLCRLGEVRGFLGDLEAAAPVLDRGVGMLLAADLQVPDLNRRAHCLLMRAQVWARRGRRAEAEADMAHADAELAAASLPINDYHWRRRAGVHALLGASDAALEELARAVDGGYRAANLGRSPDLVSLVGRPRFTDLVAAAEP